MRADAGISDAHDLVNLSVPHWGPPGAAARWGKGGVWRRNLLLIRPAIWTHVVQCRFSTCHHCCYRARDRMPYGLRRLNETTAAAPKISTKIMACAKHLGQNGFEIHKLEWLGLWAHHGITTAIASIFESQVISQKLSTVKSDFGHFHRKRHCNCKRILPRRDFQAKSLLAFHCVNELQRATANHRWEMGCTQLGFAPHLPRVPCPVHEKTLICDPEHARD